MFRAFALVFLLCCAPPSAAEEAEAHRTAAEVARAVRAAVEKDDAAALLELAQEEPPDPWLVADHLCAGGHVDAAFAFAEASPRPDVAQLPTYVERRRTSPVPKPLRAKLAKGRALFAKGELDDTSAVLEGLVDTTSINLGEAPEAETIPTVQILTTLGLTTLAEDLPGGAGTLAQAASIAATIGWRYEAQRLAVLAAEHVERLRATHQDDFTWNIALTMVARELLSVGEYETALPLLERQLERAVAMENWVTVHGAGLGLARCQRIIGRYDAAAETLQHVEKAANTLGLIPFISVALSEQSSLAEARDDTRGAIDLAERAAQLYRETGGFEVEGTTRFRIAALWRELANYPRVFQTLEICRAIARERKDVSTEAFLISQVGSTYYMLGNTRKALDHLEAARDLAGERGHLVTRATIQQMFGTIYGSDRQHTEAVAAYEEARRLYTLAGAREAASIASANLSVAHAHLGQRDAGIAAGERALTVARRTPDSSLRLRLFLTVGQAWPLLGRLERGIALQQEARAEAFRLETPGLALDASRALAITYANAGRDAEALDAALRALPLAPQVMGGLAAEESATIRASYAGLYDAALGAAWRLGKTEEVLLLSESGRAGALLESLGGRGTLQRVAVSPALLELDLEARAREARALARYRDAAKSMRRRARRQAKRALEAARTEVERVTERIQLETKAVASLVYPKPASLEAIQAALEPDQALVQYALTPSRALALVLTAQGARSVDLGPARAVEAACKALEVTRPEAVWGPATATLRALVVEPLKLPDAVRSVVISPSEALSYIPYTLLLPGRTVAYTPSATTHVLLMQEQAPPGTGVIALGDPIYTGTKLQPLPGTREEVTKVGTTTLLGAQATEAELLKAIAGRPRWRAIHLACHGLIDSEQPLRSALALTPTEDSDGLFTVLDVLGRSTPTDLAVLSACETGKGQVVRAEGIVGLTRAFMVAGAPRVICSLWKVDDAATRALMERFYELWLGAPGKPGRPPAVALGEAQAFVRGQPKWNHPYFWAAWSLWGLPR